MGTTHGQPAALPPLVYERTPGSARAPLRLPYRRREPEKTALYAIVRDHLETFLFEGQQADPDSAGYPAFVEREFRRYLDCGQLSRGFARLRCPTCAEERLVAFSCKGRLCPSCLARRAADTAADLVDRVLPVARYRQYVLTFPWELRYALAMDRAFFSKMLAAFLRKLFAWQRLRGRHLGLRDGQTGSVTFVHRFSSVLALFPHVHAVVPDGLFVPRNADDPTSPLTFAPLPAPTDDHIRDLTARVVTRLTKVARDHLGEDGRRTHDGEQDRPLLVDSGVAEAMRSPAAPPAARDVSTAATSPKPLTTRLAGFSLHAARTVEPQDRAGLERLCRYGLRAPFATDRFSLVSDEDGGQRVRYQLPKPFGPAAITELHFEPVALLRRLAAIVPAPHTNLVRYHGVFANRSRFRDRLPRPLGPDGTTPPPASETPAATREPTDTTPRPTRRRLPWAELLLRVLDVDALQCPACATPMVVLAFITDPAVVRRILGHLRLPTRPPAVAPPRELPHPAADGLDAHDHPATTEDHVSPKPTRPRAPPDDEG